MYSLGCVPWNKNDKCLNIIGFFTVIRQRNVCVNFGHKSP